MRVRWLVAVCAFALLCGTPLASARQAAFGGDVTAEATGPGGANVTYDNGGFNCTPASGSLFAVGDTPVTCDDPGATSFKVHVVDTTPPVLTTPGDIDASSTTGAAVAVTYAEPTANDIVDGPITPVCSKHSGDTFDVGTTTVNCSATDAHGHATSASFNVDITLVDNVAPVLSGGPGDISTTTDSAGGKVINYTKPTANDNLDGPLPVSCTTEPGATFPVGHTQVVCSATDAHGSHSHTSHISSRARA